MSKGITLTPSETWILDRRRRGESQEQAATRLGLSLRSYTLIENGEMLPAGRLPLKNIQKHEIAWLFRKRAKMKQYEVAAEIGLSREWIHQMEMAEIDGTRLFEYWGI